MGSPDGKRRVQVQQDAVITIEKIISRCPDLMFSRSICVGDGLAPIALFIVAAASIIDFDFPLSFLHPLAWKIVNPIAARIPVGKVIIRAPRPGSAARHGRHNAAEASTTKSQRIGLHVKTAIPTYVMAVSFLVTFFFG